MMLSVPAGASRHRPVVTSALGVTLILAWGSSYYLPAVLAAPITRDTGWSLPWVVSGLSLGLLVSGLCAPLVGHVIQQQGGRLVLATSSFLLAVGLAGLALAPSLAAFLGAWVVMGAGMSAGLYDAAFATMGRLYGRDARGAITTLTLWAGFASTVCWPLSAWLVDAYGWRSTCLVYAALHLLVCLPVHLVLIPSVTPMDPTSRSVRAAAVPNSEHEGSRQALVFGLLAAMLTMTALIASMLSVHLLAVLERRGLEVAAAVALGALIGPSQVGARVVEMLIGRRHHPIWIMIISVGLIATGVILLLVQIPLPALALILYGAGNGLQTIARGALPLVLFDPERYALFMGRLALPSLVVQALAPSAGAWLLVGDGTTMLALLATFGLSALALSLVLRWIAR
jgi:predicted MFS family arabinose efflux permease